MNRRGSDVITIVLWGVMLVIVILIAFALFFIIRNAFFSDSDNPICATEIRAHSALADLSNNQVATQINCPTKQLVVISEDSDTVNQDIADEMVNCWKQWGEGDIGLFSREEGVYCHVCSVIDISRADRIDNLPTYLEITPLERGLTYAQFLAGDEDGHVFDKNTFPEYGNWYMETDKPVAVIFYQAKGLDGFERMQSMVIGSPGQAVTVGGVAGAAGVLAIGIATGPVTIPVVLTAIAVGGGTGASAGLFASMVERPELSRMSIVVVRPLDRSEIDKLGCAYVPVANK